MSVPGGGPLLHVEHHLLLHDHLLLRLLHALHHHLHVEAQIGISRRERRIRSLHERDRLCRGRSCARYPWRSEGPRLRVRPHGLWSHCLHHGDAESGSQVERRRSPRRRRRGLPAVVSSLIAPVGAWPPATLGGSVTACLATLRWPKHAVCRPTARLARSTSATVHQMSFDWVVLGGGAPKARRLQLRKSWHARSAGRRHGWRCGRTGGCLCRRAGCDRCRRRRSGCRLHHLGSHSCRRGGSSLSRRRGSRRSAAAWSLLQSGRRMEDCGRLLGIRREIGRIQHPF